MKLYTTLLASALALGCASTPTVRYDEHLGDPFEVNVYVSADNGSLHATDWYKKAGPVQSIDGVADDCHLDTDDGKERGVKNRQQCSSLLKRGAQFRDKVLAQYQADVLDERTDVTYHSASDIILVDPKGSITYTLREGSSYMEFKAREKGKVIVAISQQTNATPLEKVMSASKGNTTNRAEFEKLFSFAKQRLEEKTTLETEVNTVLQGLGE